MGDRSPTLKIREARNSDRDFVLRLMDEALSPYYGGDHRAHGERIFSTHLSGGKDAIGYFSFEQKMFIATLHGQPVGMVHLVGKRQGTYKISPIIVAPPYQGKHGIGTQLLRFAERYAQRHSARQLYCTVAEKNRFALQFFLRNGFILAGSSYSHYKPGIREAMLYRQFLTVEDYKAFDRVNISVRSCTSEHYAQARELLLARLPEDFRGIDNTWVEALFRAYDRRDTLDVNLKYKLIFVALDRDNNVLGVAGATPKKGKPIKLMPFIATTLPAFVALLSDIPYQLQEHGRKLYVHLNPTADQAIVLQHRGWRLDAALPGAYHPDRVTQQWSLDLQGEHVMRTMRMKRRFLHLIRSGKKTLEVRVGYSSLKNIEPGERIRIMSRDESDIIRVKDVRRYNSFVEMIANEDPSSIAPDRNPEEVLPLLQRIYPRSRERLGVIVLDITLDREEKAQEESLEKGSHD